MLKTFVNENEKTVLNSYCTVISSGKTLASTVPQRTYFIGVGNANIESVCPTTTELRNMFPNSQNIQDPVYVGTTEIDGKSVPNVRLDFFTFNAMQGINCRFSIFLTKAGIKGTTSGKIQVIDDFGRTAWVTEDELKEHKIPIYSNGPADIDKDYRPCYRGEVELTKLIKCMLGIDDIRQWSQTENKFVNVTSKEALDACRCRFELADLDNIFKGKFDILKEYVKYPTKNEVKFMYGVRTASNGNIYQDICASEFMKSNSRGAYDFEQLLKNRTFNNVEYSTEPVAIYSVNPTPVVAEAPVQQPEVADAPFDPMSDMPF